MLVFAMELGFDWELPCTAAIRSSETLMSDMAIVLIVGTLFTDCKSLLGRRSKEGTP
jgi:hypothetical protein